MTQPLTFAPGYSERFQVVRLLLAACRSDCRDDPAARFAKLPEDKQREVADECFLASLGAALTALARAELTHGARADARAEPLPAHVLVNTGYEVRAVPFAAVSWGMARHRQVDDVDEPDPSSAARTRR